MGHWQRSDRDTAKQELPQPQSASAVAGSQCGGCCDYSKGETVFRMQEALFGNPSRLDRDLWLSRLADILPDGIEIPWE
ncbi:MAG: hypothetical protein HUU20_23270 [Pirellulales bacterium]|nr:hypothetical protein [Pirellulales bacterium]